MSKSLQIGLKAGERIYINGAVLRVDRKVTLELLNDVTFLLDAHVLSPEQTSTPLRQLYFMIQTMLIDQPSRAKALEMFNGLHAELMTVFRDAAMRAGLERVSDLVKRDRWFEALKVLRGLFAGEAALIASPKSTPIPARGEHPWP